MVKMKYGYMNVFGMRWETSEDLSVIRARSREIADACGHSVPVWQLVEEVLPSPQTEAEIANLMIDGAEQT